MSSFSLDNTEVVRATLNVMGLGRDYSSMDEVTEADLRAVLRSGLRRFYFPIIEDVPYQWRFLEKFHPIPVESTFAEGTIEVASGVVTLTGDVWPSDITNYFISVSGRVLFVTERTNDTALAVSHTQLTVASGTSYTAYKYRYALPSDFGEWLGGVVYSDGGSDNSRVLAGSSEAEIRLRYAVGQGQNSQTTHYAVTSTPDSGTFSIVLWPVPAAGAFIQGVYLSVPDDNLPADLTSPGSIVQVKPVYAEAVLEAIFSAAEEYHDDTAGVHAQRFERALAASIVHDRSTGGAYDFSHTTGQVPRPTYPTSIDFSSQII